MTPLELTIQGFGLYKDKQVIDFTKFKPGSIIGITGKNLDSTGGYNSNASGKTWILNAISWCIFDMIAIQSDTSLDKEVVINNKSKRAVVSLTFKDDNENIFRIENYRSKSDKGVKLWINGQEYVTNTSTLVRQKIFSILGLRSKKKEYFKDFLNSFYFSPENSTKFASKSLSDKERMSIVTRFKKLETYDILIDRIKKQYITPTNNQIEVNKRLLQRIREEIKTDFDPALILSQIEKLTADRLIIASNIKKLNTIFNNNQKHVDTLKELDKTLNQYNQERVSTENQINQLVSSIKTNLQNYKAADNAIKVAELELADAGVLDDSVFIIKEKTINDSRSKIQVEISDLNRQIQVCNTRISSLEQSYLMQCPDCASNLMFINNNDLVHYDETVVNTEIKAKQVETLNLRARIDELDILNKNLNMEMRTVQDDRRNNAKLSQSISQKLGQISILTKQRISYFNEIKDYLIDPQDISKGLIEDLNYYDSFEDYCSVISKIKEVEEQIRKVPIEEFNLSELNEYITAENTILENINSLTKEAQQQEKLRVDELALVMELDDLDRESKIYQFWIDKFKYLKNIELLEIRPQLNQYTNSVFEELGTEMEIDFKVDFENNGLTLTLTEDSGEVFPLELFSGGQSGRVGIATGLALRKISSDSDFDLGLTLWDEVFDGLDVTGQEMFYSVLESIPGFKLLISHSDNLKNFISSTILVTRENNESTIKIFN